MGQQQQLLIVLATIITGIAIVVGIQMYSGSAEERNTDQTRLELLHMVNEAQMYYRRPLAMGGGGKSFNGFSIPATLDTTENAYYTITDTDVQKIELLATCRIAEGVTIKADVYPTSHTMEIKRRKEKKE